jgi:hypothetical protein
MALNIPPAANYQSPLISVPTRSGAGPVEGNKLIVCEIDWANMGGPSNCVSINLQNNATLNFSQIVSISCDNSACGADIQFIFPDTLETMTVPAYTPKLIIPVFTNQTQFFVSSPNAEPEDVTRFSILNFIPPPIAVPTTQEQNTASGAGINSTIAGTTQLTASTISGTLENVYITWFCSNAASCTWALENGAGKVIFSGEVAGGNAPGGTEGVPAATDTWIEVLDIQDVHARFQAGLKFVISNVNGTPLQFFNVFLAYRTP